jgi:Holliday junction DNA helicase RuvA
MIVGLRGKIIERSPTALVVEVDGVSWLVQISLATFQKVGPEGSEIYLHTQLEVGRDGIELYGFATPEERADFRLLTGVSGIGPRAALNLLSRLSGPQLRQVIAQGRKEVLSSIPGIGPKKAAKLIFELKEEFERTVSELEAATGDEEAIKALTALGLTRREARERLKRIPDRANLSLTEILKEALKG